MLTVALRGVANFRPSPRHRCVHFRVFSEFRVGRGPDGYFCFPIFQFCAFPIFPLLLSGHFTSISGFLLSF